jgi:hypothetical protein
MSRVFQLSAPFKLPSEGFLERKGRALYRFEPLCFLWFVLFSLSIWRHQFGLKIQQQIESCKAKKFLPFTFFLFTKGSFLRKTSGF